MRIAMVAMILFACGVPAGAQIAHDPGWFHSGDVKLRNDLLLLNDAGVIRLPVSQWPMPRAAVRHALEQAKMHFVLNAAVQGALERVRSRVEHSRGLRVGLTAAGGEPGLLRDFDTVARETGELGIRGSYSTGGRAEISLNLSGVTDAGDDHTVRADGSHATVQLGNWLLSANTLDRWWGPAHDSSLILSNNARPMPTLMVERASARAFESPWVSWLGPWRFNFAISRMEAERQDIDAPLFMAWRVVIMPFKNIELGFSRTAQFCGDQLVCDVNSFFNMLAGNDNVGIDATPENEPGNQMAGFDIRWNSPIGNLPYAIYSQFIGEDESSYLPAKYLGQFGLEVWKPFADGGILQGYAEYSNTVCSGLSSGGPYYNCSYNQGRFNVEGYRYEGRVIGHTADSDAETYAVGATFTSPRGDVWSAAARAARLNRDGVDVRNLVSPVAADYAALELGWRGTLMGQDLALEIGAEALQPDGGTRDVEPYGHLRWQHAFHP